MRDLVQWGVAIRSGGVLLKDTSSMFRVYPESELQGMHYGYGIVIAERNGRRPYYHGGGINGFTSVLQIYPDDELNLAVLSNLDSDATKTPSWTVADHLAAAFLKP